MYRDIAGGGGGRKISNFFPHLNVPGFFRGGGGDLGCLGRAGSENDTLLPMTMTCWGGSRGGGGVQGSKVPRDGVLDPSSKMKKTAFIIIYDM